MDSTDDQQGTAPTSRPSPACRPDWSFPLPPPPPADTAFTWSQQGIAPTSRPSNAHRSIPLPPPPPPLAETTIIPTQTFEVETAASGSRQKQRSNRFFASQIDRNVNDNETSSSLGPQLWSEWKTAEPTGLEDEFLSRHMRDPNERGNNCYQRFVDSTDDQQGTEPTSRPSHACRPDWSFPLPPPPPADTAFTRSQQGTTPTSRPSNAHRSVPRRPGPRRRMWTLALGVGRFLSMASDASRHCRRRRVLEETIRTTIIPTQTFRCRRRCRIWLDTPSALGFTIT